MEASALFENELTLRGIEFATDEASGRYVLTVNGMEYLVSLANLEKGYALDQDPGRVPQFLDAVLASTHDRQASLSIDSVYWCLEPNDYEESAPIRAPISRRVDRVLVHIPSDGRTVSWVTPEMLESLSVAEQAAGARAYTNLARELSIASVEIQDVDGVRLAYLTTELPCKSALILSPNLKEIVGAKVGWPVLAVTPDRDFTYLWASEHAAFVGRVGSVVQREYARAPYPISTEVYEIGDGGLRAIGAFS